MLMREFMMDYVTARLMYEISKRNEREPQGEDAAMMLRQGKNDNSFPCQGTKSCYYCGKPDHIAYFCYKTNNKEWEQMKNVNEDNDYTFVTRNEIHSKSMYKWIMDLSVSKHMTSHKTTFDTYEVITPRDVHLGDNSAIQDIGMGSIVVEAIIEGKISQIHIKYVFHVPELHANLLSVTKLVSNRLTVQFNLKKYIVKSCNGEAIAIAPYERNLYKIHFVKVHKVEAANLVQSPTWDGALELWYCRLGHLNVKGIHTFQNMVNGMNISKKIYPTISSSVKRASKTNNIGLRFWMREGGKQPSL